MKLRSRIDLNLLAVFDAVLARGSVTDAARHLNLSQSAVSHALARLRRDFDDPLFVRTGNTLVPTALARAIQDPLRGALQGLEIAVAAAARFNPATTSRLFRVGMRPTTEAQLFEDLVLRARHAAPGVRLTSMDFRRRELVRVLADGGLDAAVDVVSRSSAGLRSVPLTSDRLVLVARPDHPSVAGSIDLSTYLDLDHVMTTPRASGLGLEDEALASLGAERRIAVRTQQITAAWRIVAGSDMVLTLSRSHAETMQRTAPLQIVELPVAVAPRTLHLLWHETVDRDPGNAWLRGMISAPVRRSHAPSS